MKNSLARSAVLALVLAAFSSLFLGAACAGERRGFDSTEGEWIKDASGVYRLVPRGGIAECRVIEEKKGGVTLTVLHMSLLDYGKVLHEVKINWRGKIVSDKNYIVKKGKRVQMEKFFPVFSNHCYRFAWRLPSEVQKKMRAYGGKYDPLTPIRADLSP